MYPLEVVPFVRDPNFLVVSRSGFPGCGMSIKFQIGPLTWPICEILYGILPGGSFSPARRDQCRAGGTFASPSPSHSAPAFSAQKFSSAAFGFLSDASDYIFTAEIVRSLSWNDGLQRPIRRSRSPRSPKFILGMFEMSNAY